MSLPTQRPSQEALWQPDLPCSFPGLPTQPRFVLGRKGPLSEATHPNTLSLPPLYGTPRPPPTQHCGCLEKNTLASKAIGYKLFINHVFPHQPLAWVCKSPSSFSRFNPTRDRSNVPTLPSTYRVPLALEKRSGCLACSQ